MADRSSAVRWGHDELERPRRVGSRRLPVGDRQRRPSSWAITPMKPCVAAVDEVEPEMVRERLVAVGALGFGEQIRHRRDAPAHPSRVRISSRRTSARVPAVGRLASAPWHALAPRRVARVRSRGGSPRSIRRPSARSITAIPYELLAATILSAQTTDVRVNMVTPALFAKYPTPFDLAAAAAPDVEDIVRSTGFYASKTKSLIGMAQALVERFDGEVPTGPRGPGDDPRSRPQDRQCRAQCGVRPPRAARRHPRQTAVEPAGADHPGRSGEDRARAERLPPSAASGVDSACG